MSDKIARKRAELELLEAEAAFVEKKKAGTLTSEDRVALRALRQAYRSGARPPVKDGASVAAIGAKAEVN
jgi:uncharacterized protein YnzC (UPF0291/DUF896 family)